MLMFLGRVLDWIESDPFRAMNVFLSFIAILATVVFIVLALLRRARPDPSYSPWSVVLALALVRRARPSPSYSP